MSKLRSVNTHFWEDNYVIDLDPTEKLLFLYLLTNPQTNMLGIYELHIRRISFDTGLDKDMVLKIFDRFTKANKVKYLEGYVILQNFLRHQAFNPNMETSAVKTWNELPLQVREDGFCEPILKALKGFTKASEPIAKVELELERELEEEREDSEVIISDEPEPDPEKDSSSVYDKKIVDVISEIDSLSENEEADKNVLLALHIWNDVNNIRPNNQTTLKAKVKNWSDPVRLMIEQDDRTYEEIWRLWKVVRADEFWQTNVLSTSKLREKFDDLSIKLLHRKKNGQSSDYEIQNAVNSIFQEE